MTTTHDTAVPAAAETGHEADPACAEEPATDTDELVLVEDELLVEDVSIDGMCGVY